MLGFWKIDYTGCKMWCLIVELSELHLFYFLGNSNVVKNKLSVLDALIFNYVVGDDSLCNHKSPLIFQRALLRVKQKDCSI